MWTDGIAAKHSRASGVGLLFCFFLVACQAKPEHATVRLLVPGKPHLAWQSEEPGKEWFRVTVRAADIVASIMVTGETGSPVLIMVPAGENRVFSAQLFDAPDLQIPTYAGTSEPINLAPGETTTVVIEVRRTNRLPSVAAVTLDPPVATRLTTLRASVSGVSDPDPADVVTLSYRWFVNGIAVMATGPTLGGAFEKRDAVWVEVTPEDDHAQGLPVVSAPVVIGNLPPSALAPTLGTGPFFETSQIMADALFGDPDPADSPYGVQTWYVNGISVPVVSTPILTGQYFNAFDSVYAVIRPFDGDDFGPPVTTGAVSIRNTMPTVQLTFAGAFTRGQDVQVNIKIVEPDAQPVTLSSFTWRINGWVVTGQTQPWLPTGLYARGDEIDVSVQPFDGYAYGPTATASTVIANALPSAPKISFVWDVAEGNGTLETYINVPSVDPDNDPVTYNYAWYRNGQLQPTPETAFQFLADFVGGDVWTVVVTPFDGFGQGTTAWTTTKVLYVGTSVAAGGDFSCAVTQKQVVVCWGANDHGQLGRGNATLGLAEIRSFPTAVSIVAAGWKHACAITVVGDVYCWGEGLSGKLGDGGSVDRYAPSKVNLSAATQISAGYAHTCALRSNGDVYCWGSNSDGQLGFGTAVTEANQPGFVSLPQVAVRVSAGRSHSCAVLINGAVYCWGANDWGQLGDGTLIERLTPTPVAALPATANTVAAGGDFTCAILVSNALMCWGHNEVGQLGNGTWVNSAVPVTTSLLSGLPTSLSAGDKHVCATTDWEVIWCWGQSYGGSLGDGTSQNRATPTFVGYGNRVAAGARHTCATDTIGSVACWGYNASSQVDPLADARVPNPSPTSVSNPFDADAGASFTCAIVAGALYCWGENTLQMVVANGPSVLWEPTLINLGDVAPMRVRASGSHVCVSDDGNWLYCWGKNDAGALGRGFVSGIEAPFTSPVIQLGPVWAFDVGWNFSCAIEEVTRNVKCWGDNQFGQIGNPLLPSPVTQPTQVSGLPVTATAIVTGERHACALLITGEVYCWGDNAFGQLGTGVVGAPLGPSRVIAGAIALAAGQQHTCAVLNDGTVVCWGANGFGQLGDLTLTDSSVPRFVIGLLGSAMNIVAGQAHTCVQLADNALQCWGDNRYGQLGDGTFDATLSAGPSVLTGATNLVAGSRHTCAKNMTSDLLCWGENVEGQVGYSYYWSPFYLPNFTSSMGY